MAIEPKWPADPMERLEAKLDYLRDNHVHSLDLRVGRLERLFIEKQRWAFWSGLATLILVIYLVLIR